MILRYFAIEKMKVTTIILLVMISGAVCRHLFIGKEEASSFLHRVRRANSFFDELAEGSVEDECYEEKCDYEEAREIFEDNYQAKAFWRNLTDQCSTSLNNCNMNGTYVCENQYNTHRCLCKNGYEGRRCETEVSRRIDLINVCMQHENLCLNGGTCVDDEDDLYYCDCLPGWFGTDCSRDINECEDDYYYPCQHGNCTNTLGAFSCQCHLGYMGEHCNVRTNQP